MGKNTGKNKRKNLSGKYGQKLLDYSKKSATDALKTTSDLIHNISTNTITKASRSTTK